MKFTLRSLGVYCALAGVASACFAAPITKNTGPISIDYNHVEYSASGGLHLFGGVTMKSTQYFVSAGDVLVEQTEGKVKTFKRATAKPLPGEQVLLTFQDAGDMKSLKALADQAVITPEADRIGGARIDLTGHVVIETKAEDASSGPSKGALLNAPSKTTLEKATIRLGPAPDYPRIEGEHGHMTLTPQF